MVIGNQLITMIFNMVAAFFENLIPRILTIRIPMYTDGYIHLHFWFIGGWL